MCVDALGIVRTGPVKGKYKDCVSYLLELEKHSERRQQKMLRSQELAQPKISKKKAKGQISSEDENKH